MELSKDGLMIDFSSLVTYNKSIEFPIHAIGKMLNMDDMYNDLRRHVGQASFSAKLSHENKKWSIVE